MMQREVEDSDHPEDIQNQIESKKRQAARLLRQLNPTLDS
jgi:hypothetical protein